ncbi:amino acid permease/ SLC12A domain-containing protein [Schizophyllum amplum]|uniref:Amino acid permease/ SLC12A domain-containing protein n=1 Tax=Schizophyllum amplum TaxID=97359 RepID=A0A550CQJ5_9AGAR|nr:amino acid permease/ SLC12A domain-containing protein [Auriculariopsis ampla]
MADEEKYSASESLADAGQEYSPHSAVAKEGVALKRGLNARHTALIAIASGIGTGLFLGSGIALSNAGPLGLLLGYIIMGFITAEIAYISAETIGFLPVSGGFTRFIPRFTNRALGLTAAWTFWYLLSINGPAEVAAASSLVAFWRTDISIAVWITVFAVPIVVLNFFPVRLYGEIEFSFGLLKSLLVMILVVTSLVVDVGGGPRHEYIGGRYWHPSPIKEYLVDGSTGRFLAVWSVLINAAYAMGNIQVATTSASEVQNPRQNVPKAMRRVFYRIFFFYVISVLFVGLIQDSNDARLSTTSGTAASPFVIAFETAGIKILPSFINAIVITSAWSSGNGMLFLASRTLVGLAAEGAAPGVFLRTNRYGSPYVAVAASALLMPLAYLNCGSETPQTVFSWFINLISTAGLNIWIIICFSYVRFYYGMKKQGVSRDELPYKSWGQPYCAIAAGFMCFIIVFFSGFAVFFPGNWSVSGFLSTYINCFMCIGLYVVLKLTIKSPWIGYEEMDFSEMKAIREEARFREAQAEMKGHAPGWRRFLEKFVDE